MLLALALGVGMTASSSGCGITAASGQQGGGHSGHDAPDDGDDGAPSPPCDGDCTGTMTCALVMSCSAVALVTSGTRAIDLPMLADNTPWKSVRHTALVPAPEPPPPRA
jgi:hypothetical protein